MLIYVRMTKLPVCVCVGDGGRGGSLFAAEATPRSTRGIVPQHNDRVENARFRCRSAVCTGRDRLGQNTVVYGRSALVLTAVRGGIPHIHTHGHVPHAACGVCGRCARMWAAVG